jgi:ABC-type amino acid transport substrate-binding protein
METNNVELAEQHRSQDKSTGGGSKAGLLLMGMLLALGLGAAGVTISSVALSKANENEDIFTNLRVVPLEDPVEIVGPATTDGPTTNVDSTTNEDATPGFSPTLQAIYDRGALKCAVVLSPGFTAVRDTGELYGIDIDIVSSC